MFRQLNLRSFFNFLSRNKLYTAINIFGLSVSLMFVLLIANFTQRQLTVDTQHTKADRIFVVGSEKSIMSGYYLQKYLLDRYPEIESTCAIGCSGRTGAEYEYVRIGTQQVNATVLYADTTFFRMFDFPLASGDREQALAARDNVILSESFARKTFGLFDPLGQILRIGADSLDTAKDFVVSAVIKDIDNSIIPNQDLILRAERLTEIEPMNDEHMRNAGSVSTFVLVREGADVQSKVPDMLSYFKTFYWPFLGKFFQEVQLIALPDAYFMVDRDNVLLHGNWLFVLLLIAVGLVILIFAVMNYINLTVAQTGFRAKEMAARRLLGASRGEVVFKLILESTILCAVAFWFAFALALAVEPYAIQLLGRKIAILGDLRPTTVAAYAGLIVVLGVLAGLMPALVVSRFKPLDMVSGAFRRKTKMVYSNVLITVQNVITMVLIAGALTISLQIRHLINAPLGYNTKDILDIPTEIFKDYGKIQQFCNELRQLPQVEAVALGNGTPLNYGDSDATEYGTDKMIHMSSFYGDSVYFRILGFEFLHNLDRKGKWILNESALPYLGITAETMSIKMGYKDCRTVSIGPIVRDFKVGPILTEPVSVMMFDMGNYDRYYRNGALLCTFPTNILVKIQGNQTEAFEAIQSVYRAVSDSNTFEGKYVEQQIAESFAEQQQLLRIVGIFTLVAVLISALGLLAMSTYYIQQKRQEVAVRKVFGSTRAEILRRLMSHFMRLVGVAFVLAVPIGWYLLSRWLEDYSVRISLSPLIFIAAGLFVAVVAVVVVFWQSRRAADANPIDSIKN